MRQRLLNCEFVNDSAFKVDLTNKAKLLYFYMFSCADDKGFVGNAQELVDTLTKNDDEHHTQGTLDLIPENFQSALEELVDRGFLYRFTNTHKNQVYLIRHWYFHNRLYDRAWTNYGKYLKKVKLVNNEYVLRGQGKEEEIESIESGENDIKWDKLMNALEEQGKKNQKPIDEDDPFANCGQ